MNKHQPKPLPQANHDLEIRLSQEDVFTLCNRPEYKTWMAQLGSHVVRLLGTEPRVRLHAYEQGAADLVAADLYSVGSKASVTITIAISPGEAILSPPNDDQLDIALPGTACALQFIQDLLRLTHQLPSPPAYFEVLPWGMQFEERCEPMS